MTSGQKVGNLRLISGEDFFFFLEITMILVQKVGILRLISGEDFSNDPLNVSFKKLSFYDKGLPTLAYDIRSSEQTLPHHLQTKLAELKPTNHYSCKSTYIQ